MKNQDDLLKGGGFSLLGAYLLYWIYNQPCNLTQPGIPEELSIILCLSTDVKFIIVSIIGSAMLFAGISRLVKSV